MVRIMRELGKIINAKDMESTFGLMVLLIMDNGLTIFQMVKVK